MDLQDLKIFCLVEEYQTKNNYSCVSDEDCECRECGACWMTENEMKVILNKLES